MSDLVGSVAAVAERLELSESTVRRLIKAGKLPAWEWGPRATRIPWKALEEYINSISTQATLTDGHVAP